MWSPKKAQIKSKKLKLTSNRLKLTSNKLKLTSNVLKSTLKRLKSTSKRLNQPQKSLLPSQQLDKIPPLGGEKERIYTPVRMCRTCSPRSVILVGLHSRYTGYYPSLILPKTGYPGFRIIGNSDVQLLVNKLLDFKFLTHAFDDLKSTSSILKYPGLIIIFSTYVSIFTL